MPEDEHEGADASLVVGPVGPVGPVGDVMRQRWKLLVAYDGAAFRGFALQPEVPTVAGDLRHALSRTARLQS